MQGPGIFLAQFAGDEAPFDTLENVCRFMAEAGYQGIQLPTWESRYYDLQKMAESKDYCDEIKGTIAQAGLEITELSTHLQGQLLAVHPCYDELFDAFAPKEVHGNKSARTKWAIDQLKLSAKASQNLGIDKHVSFSGALLWPYIYPWPQRSAGLVEEGFKQLANVWTPILNYFDDCGVDVCYELHPGEDLHDGLTFEMFLDACGNHQRANILYDPSHFILQQLNYLEFRDVYH